LRRPRQNRGRCWKPTRNTTPRMLVTKMAECLETEHTCGRGPLRRWLWPVGPKLVFEQMAAPVPEVMNGSLYIIKTSICLCSKVSALGVWFTCL
jgi:hypothetical protein